MRLKRLRVRNFRCFKDEVLLELGDFTALVGRNDAGKSTVLQALALFFGEYTPDEGDASIDGNKSDMRVICEFDSLPEAVVLDAKHATTLTAEHLLNADGYLEVHQIYDGALKKPKRTATIAYARHPTSENVSDLLYLKNTELKARAQSLGVDLSTLDKRINAELRAAILRTVDDPALQSQEIDLDKEDAKKIWNVLQKHLPVYAVFYSDRKSSDQDEEAQDPMKTAIAEALQQRQNELEELARHVRSEVVAIARSTVEKLAEMDPELAHALNPQFGKPNWASVFKVSLTDDENIPVNKRGSGVRRLILLNFFRAKAEKRLRDGDAPGIIYAIEEPETSQHPSNQKLLFEALRELSEQPGCQMIVTTHTPVLVRDLPLQCLQYVDRSDPSGPRIASGNDVTYKKIASTLGVIPDHDVKLFIGLEGINDIDFLTGISQVLSDEGEDVPNLKKLETEGAVVFVPLGGSNLMLWTHRLAGLNRPEFHLFDRDVAPPVASPHEEAVAAINARQNASAVLTGKLEMENYLHVDAIAGSLGVAIQHSDFGDVPDLVAEQLYIKHGGQAAWSALAQEKRRKKVSRAKRRLNIEATMAMTAARLDAVDPNGDVRAWLTEIKRMLESE